MYDELMANHQLYTLSAYSTGAFLPYHWLYIYINENILEGCGSNSAVPYVLYNTQLYLTHSLLSSYRARHIARPIYKNS